jgi:hypothetical protein
MSSGNGHKTELGNAPRWDDPAMDERLKIEWVDPMGLTPDRELEKYWPLEDPQEPSEAAFIGDVCERGVLDPLKISPDGRFVWDGRRRLRAAKRFAEKVRLVPVMRCREEDRQWVILFGITHRRNMTPSAQVYVGYPWWSKVLAGAKERRKGRLIPDAANRTCPGRFDRVENLRNPLSNSKGPYGPFENLTIRKLAEKLGIDHKEFERCQAVLKLFAEHPEAREEWEPRILSGRASFWNVLSGCAGDLAGRKHEGKAPAEFRGPAVAQCFRVIKTFARRLKDFEALSKADKRVVQEDLAKQLLAGKRKMSEGQLEAVADAMDEQAAMMRRLARLAKEEAE